MEIYAVKISGISEQDLNEIRLLINLDKKCMIEKFVNKKDKIRAAIGAILIRTV